MTLAVASTACLQCSFGAAPSVLTILPINKTFSTNQPVATIMDHTPMLNIAPFGACSSAFLDNSSIHKSKEIKPLVGLLKTKGLTLYFLPPYSP